MPSSHMKSDREAVWVNFLGSPDVDVFARSRRSRVEVRVVRTKFSAECFHVLIISISGKSHWVATCHPCASQLRE